MRSPDGGKTWQSVSGLGEIDYHDIEVAGDLVVALRVDQPDVQVSTRRRARRSRAAPRPPWRARCRPHDQPGRRRSSGRSGTEQGTFLSTNAGGSWRQRDTTFGARVAWAARTSSTAPGSTARCARAPTAASRGEEVGDDRRRAEGLRRRPDGELYAYVAGGKIRRSTDGGKTWTDWSACSVTSHDDGVSSQRRPLRSSRRAYRAPPRGAPDALAGHGDGKLACPRCDAPVHARRARWRPPTCCGAGTADTTPSCATSCRWTQPTRPARVEIRIR